MVFMTIDPKTLLVVLTFSTLFLAFILVFYKATRETYPGFSMWVYGTITMAIGAMLLAFRGVVPVGLSVLIGNVAFPIGAVYLLLGTKRFLDLPAPNKFIWLVPLITLLCLIFFLPGLCHHCSPRCGDLLEPDHGELVNNLVVVASCSS